MSTSVAASDRDLRALADIVSQDRPDLPAGDGLPPSLLADLMDQIRCDVISFEGFDSRRQETWLFQSIPGRGDAVVEDLDPVHWEHYWDCQPCSYPDRTGDLRSIIKIGDFYSARQWPFRRHLLRHLPAAGARARSDAHPAPGVRPRRWAGPDHAAVLFPRARTGFIRPRPGGAHAAAPPPAPGLSRCRAAPPPRSPAHPRQTDLLRLVAAGHTNTQIARRLGISEATVRTHLENIYGRLQVSSRTAAVIRAFGELTAS